MSNAQTDTPAHRVRKPKKAPPAVPFNLSNMLAEAAWSEADQALARALVDLDMLDVAVAAAAKRLRRGEGDAEAEALEDAHFVVRQSLMQAARKRGFVGLGAAGAVEAFDPARHELVKSSTKPPARVKVVVCGWQRGPGADAQILARARVTPARSRGARA